MKTVCIVQARLASTRLPAKVLLPLPTGRTVLEEVVHRCTQISGVDYVDVAVPDNEGGRLLSHHLITSKVRGRIHIGVGPEMDVLARYSKVASELEADTILRVTSDCPLIDPVRCAGVLESCDRGSRYVRLSAGGWSCEAFTAEALYLADQSAEDAYDREHVGPWMARNISPSTTAELRETADGRTPPPSLDTLDDYIRIWKIFEDQIAADPSLRAA